MKKSLITTLAAVSLTALIAAPLSAAPAPTASVKDSGGFSELQSCQ
jgi:hypothetical protein